MKLPELNSAQDEFLAELSNGVHDMPSTRKELVLMLESFLVMYNYEKHEEGFIFHSSKAFLKTLARLGKSDVLGFVYISSAMQVVEKRKSFKQLSDSTKNRNIKAERLLIEYLIKNKWIAVHGNQARITVEGSSKLNHMEFVNQY